MVRTQISLDDETYREIKRRAYENNQSMAAVIRGLLNKAIFKKGKPKQKRLKLSDFAFIGSASEAKPDNVSERHDEILGEADW